MQKKGIKRKGDYDADTLDQHEVNALLNVLEHDDGEDGNVGEVRLSMPMFAALLSQRRKERRPRPPVAYAISRADYRGRVASAANHATFEVTVVVDVFAPGWTSVPLFGTALALASAEVRINGEGEAPKPAKGKRAKAAAAAGDGAAEAEATEGATDAEAPRAVLNSESGEHTLLACGAGMYEVVLKLNVPLLGATAASGLEMRVPQAAVSSFMLTVPKGGAEITLSPKLGAVTEDADGGEATAVRAMLPPTDRVRCEWGEAKPAIPAAAVKPLATADVATLASIGEGVMVCQSQVTMTMLQGALKRCRFELPADVNVLGVSGDSVKTWELEKPDGAEQQQVIVDLSYDITSEFDVNASYERSMDETSGRIGAPVLTVHDVERQRGFLGVEARTNVEIAAPVADDVARIDVQELPEWLIERANNPILFGFKYLRAPYRVELEVTKHRDLDVLVAAVDVAFIEATLVEDGRLMTKARLMVRNNQQQFLRVELPPQSTVWSTFVTDSPVKPAADKEKPDCLLIALHKSQGAADAQNAFPVEIVYLTAVPELTRNGQTRVQTPKIDVPINHVLLKLNLPTGYRFRDFDGSLKKVDSFSRSFTMASPVRQERRYASPRRMSETQMLSNVAYDDADEEAGEEIQQQEYTRNVMPQAQVAMAPVMSKKAGFAFPSVEFKSKGVLPVRMDVPSVGAEYRFEKLIVLSEFAECTFKYKKK